MEGHDRIVLISELYRSTGERGTRMYVAHKSLVYDVTDCLRWKSGLHAGLHFPSQDLPAELGEARPTPPIDPLSNAIPTEYLNLRSML